MAQRNEIGAVYAAGIIQGVALVTFPAASAIFSSPAYFRLSNTEYGGMFVPQAIMAIASSLMGAGLTRHLGIKRIFLLGLIAGSAGDDVPRPKPVRDAPALTCLRYSADSDDLHGGRIRVDGTGHKHLRRSVPSKQCG